MLPIIKVYGIDLCRNIRCSRLCFEIKFRFFVHIEEYTVRKSIFTAQPLYIFHFLYLLFIAIYLSIYLFNTLCMSLSSIRQEADYFIHTNWAKSSELVKPLNSHVLFFSRINMAFVSPGHPTV